MKRVVFSLCGLALIGCCAACLVFLAPYMFIPRMSLTIADEMLLSAIGAAGFVSAIGAVWLFNESSKGDKP